MYSFHMKSMEYGLQYRDVRGKLQGYKDKGYLANIIEENNNNSVLYLRSWL